VGKNQAKAQSHTALGLRLACCRSMAKFLSEARAMGPTERREDRSEPSSFRCRAPPEHKNRSRRGVALLHSFTYEESEEAVPRCHGKRFPLRHGPLGGLAMTE